MKLSNQQIARDNEMQVLQAVGHVGWLSVTQASGWAWSESNAHSARVSADRTLKRLLEKKFVIARDSSLRMCVYVLTKSGAACANECVRKEQGLRDDVELFRDGYSLSLLDCGRQKLAVEYLTKQHREGKTVLGAATVRKSIEIGMLDAKLKNADGFVYDNETEDAHAVLVVRNTHEELIEKAKRLRKAAGKIVLLGQPGIVRHFKKELSC